MPAASAWSSRSLRPGAKKVGKKRRCARARHQCEVLRAAVEYANANHFSAEGLNYSPIKGPEGNIEFLLFVRHDPAPAALAEELIEKTVRAAHEALDKAPNLH